MAGRFEHAALQRIIRSSIRAISMEGKVNEAAPQLIKQTAPLPTQKVHHTPAFPLLVAAIAAGRGGGGPMVLKLDPGCTGGGGPMLPGCMGGGVPCSLV